MGKKMTVDFEWLKDSKRIIKETTGGDKAQLFLANEARRLMQPYVPELNHILIKDVRTYVENGKGVVHYLVPYARFQWGGKVMVSSITGSPWSKGEAKVMTTRDLNYNKPNATAHWDKAMLTARRADLARALQNFIKQKGS